MTTYHRYPEMIFRGGGYQQGERRENMKKLAVMIVMGVAVLGFLVGGCEQKKAEETPAAQKYPVKKAPTGC
jgi:hypothetical protein